MRESIMINISQKEIESLGSSPHFRLKVAQDKLEACVREELLRICRDIPSPQRSDQEQLHSSEHQPKISESSNRFLKKLIHAIKKR